MMPGTWDDDKLGQTTDPTPPTSGYLTGPVRPFTASFEGFGAHETGLPNTVTVSISGAEDPALARHVEQHPDELDWAADLGWRQMVRLDTNYKSTRPGPHPVDLTREDAVQLAAALLAAVAASFNYAQYGQLRPVEAAQLLRRLEDVGYELAELRGHTLGDLLDHTNLDPDAEQPLTPDTSPDTDEGDDHVR